MTTMKKPVSQNADAQKRIVPLVSRREGQFRIRRAATLRQRGGRRIGSGYYMSSRQYQCLVGKFSTTPIAQVYHAIEICSWIGNRSESHGANHRNYSRFQLLCSEKRTGGFPATMTSPANRPEPENIDEVVPVGICTCPDCGSPLSDLQTHSQFQSDIVVSTIEREFKIASGFCPDCKCRHHARHPLQTSDALGAAGKQIGPVALTMATEMKHDLGVSYDNISQFLETYFGIYVNPFTILQAEDRLFEKAMPTFNMLLDALRKCRIVHADETGWRIGRVNAWLWVFSSKNVTIYAIRYSRGSASWSGIGNRPIQKHGQVC